MPEEREAEHSPPESRRLEPLRTTTSDKVAEMLRADIAAGVLTPGMRLRQDRIAERLGVSITPVREAFALLRSDGLLTSDPHRGVEVKVPREEELDELYEMRIVLERLAVEFAVPRVTEEELAEIEARLKYLRELPLGGDYTEANRDFHLALYMPARMPRLQETIDRLRASSDLFLHFFLDATDGVTWPKEFRQTADIEHGEIAKAYREGDKDKAADLLERHLRGTAAYLGRFFAERAAALRLPTDRP